MATGGKQTFTRHVQNDDVVGGKMPAMCDPCGRRKKTTPVTAVCLTCDVMLCRRCRERHNIYVLGEHVFETIDDASIETVLVDMQGLDRCSVHEKMLRYICKDHECLCCDDCQFDHHRTCKDVYKLKDVASDSSKSLIESVENVQKVISSAKVVINNCDIQGKAREEHINEIRSEIDCKNKEIMNHIDGAKRGILSDLDKHFTSDKTRLDGVKHDAETVQTNLQGLMALHENVIRNGTDVEKFILDFNCKRKATFGTAKLNEVQSKNYTVQHTLKWNHHLMTAMNEHIVSLRHTQLPSAMGTPVDNDNVVGKANLHLF